MRSFAQFAPQAWRTWRGRRDPKVVAGLSLSMCLIAAGAHRPGVPSLVNVPLAAFMVWLKAVYRPGQQIVQPLPMSEQ